MMMGMAGSLCSALPGYRVRRKVPRCSVLAFMSTTEIGGLRFPAESISPERGYPVVLRRFDDDRSAVDSRQADP